MKLTQEDKKLIEKAKQVIVKSKPVDLIDTGDVGAALITPKGNIYWGVCVGFFCGISSCAEYQAVGSMISNGEKYIKSIVAVWYDEKSGRYQVIPPCGKCREMIKQASKKNQDTKVIISETKKINLKQLLPHQWGDTLDK